jgi:hypothetical protein
MGKRNYLDFININREKQKIWIIWREFFEKWNHSHWWHAPWSSKVNNNLRSTVHNQQINLKTVYKELKDRVSFKNIETLTYRRILIRSLVDMKLPWLQRINHHYLGLVLLYGFHLNLPSTFTWRILKKKTTKREYIFHCFP